MCMCFFNIIEALSQMVFFNTTRNFVSIYCWFGAGLQGDKIAASSAYFVPIKVH